MQVTVEPEALAEWSAQARRTGTRLHARLAALDHDLAPLQHTWQGAAADGFAARHGQWQQAAAGLLATLGELARLIDTAHANYLAATSANTAIWQAHIPSTAVVVHAMAAGDGRGRGHGRIEADLEDIRVAVRAIVVATEDLAAAWGALSSGLAGSAGMAGGADGAAFAADYDVMVAAAWQGWRRSVLMVDGIAGGLAATGNNLAAAERASTAGTPAPFSPITARGTPVPGPGPPPPAGGGRTGDGLVAFWPTADSERLRSAAGAWRTSAAGVRGAVDAVFAAVDVLLERNPDASLQEMGRFTRATLSEDPTSGLVGVLAGTCGRIASACSGLADLTERTRRRMLDAVAHYASGSEWYHDAADLIDKIVRVRPGRFLATAEDAYLLHLDLSSIHDEHLRAVASLRGELHPAGADRMARIATAMVPPTPVPAGTCMLSSPDGATGDPLPERQREALIGEVVAAGHKISPADVVQIARAPDGRVVWLERGDGQSGLSHILRTGRIRDFVNRGVPHADIPSVAVRAVTSGRLLGQVPNGGDVYDLDLGAGRHTKVVVVVGSNGYIVTARPLSTAEEKALELGGR